MASVETLSDVELAAAVALDVAEPRRDPADSFVLHAPLELAARVALLPHVAPEGRGEARSRIADIAVQLDGFGPGIGPVASRSFDSTAEAAAYLQAAIAAGDLDGVDSAAAWLGHTASASELSALLADRLIPSLAAAAHAPIFLYHLPRAAPRGELPGELLRPLARELARNPTWALSWFADAPSDPNRARTGSADGLFAALRATPRLGSPGSDFIYPVMAQAERSGIAAALLGEETGGLALRDATAMILRAAALTMLHEPGEHAPYGWSHCLTMPQAVLGLAHRCVEPRVAVAIAATYVVGFRAAFAREALEATWSADDPHVGVRDALEGKPADAAAAAWHTPPERQAELVTVLATRAAAHHDAHLVKYTLACLDAAAALRGDARLYLSAAAALHAWWALHDLTPAALASG